MTREERMASLYLGLLRGGWEPWIEQAGAPWARRERLGQFTTMLCCGDVRTEKALGNCLWSIRDAGALRDSYEDWLKGHIRQRIVELSIGRDDPVHLSFERGLLRIADQMATELALKDIGGT